jgi:head-tail adaptor
MLTEVELNAMRDVAAEALPGTCVIQSLGGSVDQYGDRTETWSAAGTVDCRIAPIRATEREVGERISADADFVVTLPQSASVTTNSRILTGGGTFNVEAIRDRSYEVTQRLEVVKQT